MTARPRNALIHHVLVALLMLLVGAGLAACNIPAGSDCDASDLPAAINMRPDWGAFVDSLSPVLTWDYAGSCEPDSFHVRVDGGGRAQEATVDARTMAWTPDALDPATTYSWTVRAVSGSTEGDYAVARFRTGPRCDPSDPASTSAPELLSPADGAVVTDTVAASAHGEVLSTGFRADLDWEAPTGCLLSHGYRVEVARSASFSPSTLVDSWDATDPPAYFWSLWREWHDCERYFWRVSPLLDYDIVGPASETWSFIVNTSGLLCPPELAREPIADLGPGIELPLTGHGAIAGHVFHDECTTPYVTTDVAPPGCVIMPDGSIEANGVLDPGETGIEGVTVRINTGACPGTTGWTYTTDASGHYGFYNLTAGTYCLEINAEADGNDAILIPGNWTMPYRWYGPGPISVDVTLGSDDDISRLNDFGWDYQFLPSPSGGTPFARVLTDARCRLGPGFDYPILTYLSQGLSFPIIGRLEQGGWWQLRAPDLEKPCWIGEDVVKPYGDLTKVPLAIAPALPTREPTKVPPAQGCRCWTGNVCQTISQCPAQCTPCP